jgi:hypothetical protein
MEKLKTFGSLLMTMVSCFVIGLYTSSTFKYGETIEPHRWVITSFIGLIFLIIFLINYRKK